MATMKLFKLPPRSAFHFGQRGVGVEETQVFCRADTLFSALCVILRQLEGVAALEAFLERFPGPGEEVDAPPFRLTSAFPYAGDVLFLPKPSVPARLTEMVRLEHGKQLKGVTFVSQGIWATWLNNGDLTPYLEDDCFLHDGSLWLTHGERDKLAPFYDAEPHETRLWKTQTVPRVTIDRVTNSSAVYQAGRVRYRRVEGDTDVMRAGLWVAIEWLDHDHAPQDLKLLTRCLQVLGDSGLGGERSIGYGQFDLEGPFDFEGFDIEGQGDRWLTLSTYHPRAQEMGQGNVLGAGSAYTVLIRRGWIGSPEGSSYRRPLVRMLGEGSVFHHPAAGAQVSYGDLADVTPDVMDPDQGATSGHKVWRYGIAFPVPVGIPVKEEETAHG